MDLKDKIKVMQHFAEGGKVEYSYLRLNAWKPTDAPVWNWDSYDYRIQPTKTKQPLTAADFPPGTVIRDKTCSNAWRQVNLVSENSYWAFPWTYPQHFDSATMMDNYEYSTDQGKTWLPCYKEV